MPSGDNVFKFNRKFMLKTVKFQEWDGFYLVNNWGKNQTNEQVGKWSQYGKF